MKKILTIDGGGIKGVFPAAFLASIEDIVGDRIGKYFDLIVGTSTGGILALGLGLGFTAKELLAFYEEYGATIFRSRWVWRLPVINFISGLAATRYKQEPLRNALEQKFGNKLLGECLTRVVIPSLNLETGQVHVYKTSHHPKLVTDYKEKVVDVALATSAAPTYFPAFRATSGVPLVDGGLWANNPVGLSVVEAIGILGWMATDIKVFSLGCTSEALNVRFGRHFALGQLYWAKKISDVFMSAQSSHSLGTAQLLIGKENIFRYNPTVANGKFALDSIEEMSSLRGMGSEYARDTISSIKIFFEEEASPFSPYHGLYNIA
ncbi:CBASS cGAMP-activated phospholipase [Desulfosporosinus metallidurans]|nr:CBASS cGAMP-activated phospholipase [Desulfosporosinus metallidurans]